MSERLEVRKTYKLFIGGAFPRSESGRTYDVADHTGEFIANACLASRKDLRDAVVVARGAQAKWAGSTAYLRGQILYRIAEMMEGRRDQFADEISASTGVTTDVALKEVDAAIDTWVWYAGWSDKLGSIAGSTNPVSGPYYNFTIPEPMGVIGVLAAENPSLLVLVQALSPIWVSVNTAIAQANSA